MNYTESAQILNITSTIDCPKELKKHYYIAARKYHTDVSDLTNDTMMQLVNNAYNWLKDHLPIFIKEQVKDTGPTLSDELKAAIDAIKFIPDINIELMGTWIWVTGNTKESKDIFKANGFRWSPKKTSWYFAPTTKEKRRYSGKKSLAEIRTHYGSKTIAKGYRRQLA